MLRVCFLLFLIVLVWGLLKGDVDDVAQRRPLDLPVTVPGSSDEEDDVPEAILFYGMEYESDAFFWCLDRSCSMAVDSKLPTLQQETILAIKSLSEDAEFGLVEFHHLHTLWRTVPVRATLAAKIESYQWIYGLTAYGGTRMAAPVVSTIVLSQLSMKRHKVVIVVGDGIPADVETTLLHSRLVNVQRTPVNTILISYAPGANFMRALTAYGGTFEFVP